MEEIIHFNKKTERGALVNIANTLKKSFGNQTLEYNFTPNLNQKEILINGPEGIYENQRAWGIMITILRRFKFNEKDLQFTLKQTNEKEERYVA